jgi:hypothetical protein
VVGGDDEFDAYPLYQAAQGEIFAETKTPRSLSSFGITAGERELIFIVEASGDVQYNLERTSVSPWEIEIAQGEVAAQLPEKVAAFIKAYEALFYRGNQGKDVAEDAVNLAKKVGATLDRVPRSEWVQGEGQRKPEPKPGEGDPDPAPEKEEGPKTKRDKSEKRKKRDKTTVLMARVPKVQFVDARALDPHRVRYDSVKKRIMLNRGANDCATVLKSLGTPKRQAAFEDDVREALLAAWISFCNQNQRVPNEEEIDAMYSAVVVCKV